MPTLELLTEEDLAERRERLLEEAAMTEHELRARARTYALSEREAGILAEIDGLDFLLAE